MNKYLTIAKQAVRKAGGILMDGFRTQHRLKYKMDKHQGIVTEIDTKAEDAMVRMIRKAFPDHAILGEERGLDKKINSSYLWIIDPVDGTTNYSHGIPFFNTTIALQYNGSTILGLVYQPITKEFFVAIRGRGAWRNDMRIHVANTLVLTKAYGFMEWTAVDPIVDRTGSSVFAALRRAHVRVRNIASGALSTAYVAAGNTDYVVSLDSHLWDVAAGLLLVEEAGGRATDFSGKDPHRMWKRNPLVRAPILCSNGLLHAKLLPFVQNVL